jgi:hypothetical protein
MDEKKTKYEFEFMQLVMSLHGSAWMMLGKVMYPLTGKIEKNLRGAKASIDALMMLQEKTKGNLSKSEEDYLSNIVHQLQLNFVEESKREEPKPEGKKEAVEKKPKKGKGKSKKKKKGKK